MTNLNEQQGDKSKDLCSDHKFLKTFYRNLLIKRKQFDSFDSCQTFFSIIFRIAGVITINELTL